MGALDAAAFVFCVEIETTNQFEWPPIHPTN
jgi:hypothetical protein